MSEEFEQIKQITTTTQMLHKILLQFLFLLCDSCS